MCQSASKRLENITFSTWLPVLLVNELSRNVTRFMNEAKSCVLLTCRRRFRWRGGLVPWPGKWVREEEATQGRNCGRWWSTANGPSALPTNKWSQLKRKTKRKSKIPVLGSSHLKFVSHALHTCPIVWSSALYASSFWWTNCANSAFLSTSLKKITSTIIDSTQSRSVSDIHGSGNAPAVSNARILAKSGAQRCQLLRASLQIHESTVEASRVVIKLECVRGIQRKHLQETRWLKSHCYEV